MKVSKLNRLLSTTEWWLGLLLSIPWFLMALTAGVVGHVLVGWSVTVVLVALVTGPTTALTMLHTIWQWRYGRATGMYRSRHR